MSHNNLFLTQIAKDYNADIEAVRFANIPGNMCGKVTASKLRDGYLIQIDKEKMRCTNHIFFILFHEIAHVQLFHFGPTFHSSDESFKEEREKQADRWAFKELDMIDNENRPTADNITCHECLTTNATSCLKHKT
jgi:hypothetical protein